MTMRQSLPFFPGYAADSHRRADGVQVRELVAHDEHTGGVRDELGQGVRHDAALDLCPGLDLVAAPTEELEVEAVFMTAWSPLESAISAARELNW